MSTFDIVIPSKPKIVREEGWSGTYEIDGLYPGYGHTLGNSLRRIILSSLPGAAVTKVKVKGVDHEFSVLPGIKEDVITILLNLKRLRVQLSTDEPQVLTLSAKGVLNITAKAIEHPGQVEILNPELHIAHLTDKGAELDMEITVEKGLGYLSKEILHKDRVDVAAIALDASFSPIKKCNYEVENMRVGDRTDFNRLRLSIETDGTITAREAMEKSIGLMITQLKAIVGWKEEEPAIEENDKKSVAGGEKNRPGVKKTFIYCQFPQTPNGHLCFSAPPVNALDNSNFCSGGGFSR